MEPKDFEQKLKVGFQQGDPENELPETLDFLVELSKDNAWMRPKDIELFGHFFNALKQHVEIENLSKRQNFGTLLAYIAVDAAEIKSPKLSDFLALAIKSFSVVTESEPLLALFTLALQTDENKFAFLLKELDKAFNQNSSSDSKINRFQLLSYMAFRLRFSNEQSTDVERLRLLADNLVENNALEAVTGKALMQLVHESQGHFSPFVYNEIGSALLTLDEIRFGEISEPENLASFFTATREFQNKLITLKNKSKEERLNKALALSYAKSFMYAHLFSDVVLGNMFQSWSKMAEEWKEKVVEQYFLRKVEIGLSTQQKTNLVRVDKTSGGALFAYFEKVLPNSWVLYENQFLNFNLIYDCTRTFHSN